MEAVELPLLSLASRRSWSVAQTPNKLKESPAATKKDVAVGQVMRRTRSAIKLSGLHIESLSQKSTTRSVKRRRLSEAEISPSIGSTVGTHQAGECEQDDSDSSTIPAAPSDSASCGYPSSLLVYCFYLWSIQQ